MNDRITQQKQQIQELLASAQSIGVVLSENQTMDSVAAALSIALILQDSGKNSQVVSLKDPIVEHSSLVGIDQIRKSFTGSSKTLTVSFPYQDGQIEKVSYNIEGDRLNVNLFAQANGITFTEKDIRYIWQGSTPSLILTIGVSNISEIQGFIDPSVAKIINIDNNPQNTQFGDIVLFDPFFSSLSEMIARVADLLGMQVEFDVAQNLLDGIMSATSNFSSPKTSPLAFEMAGVLMQKGAIRRVQKPDAVTDTSLQMLGGTPQNFPKQSQFNKQNPINQFSDVQNKKNQFQQDLEDVQNFQPEDMRYSSQPQDFGKMQPSMNQNARMEDIKSQLQNMPTTRMPEEKTEEPHIPTEDQAPSDWFTPKVFKSNKN